MRNVPAFVICRTPLNGLYFTLCTANESTFKLVSDSPLISNPTLTVGAPLPIQSPGICTDPSNVIAVAFGNLPICQRTTLLISSWATFPCVADNENDNVSGGNGISNST